LAAAIQVEVVVAVVAREATAVTAVAESEF
jgi:hypothetical protein